MNPFDLFTGESKKQLAAALEKNTAKMDEAIKVLTDQGQQNGTQVVDLAKLLANSLQSIQEGLQTTALQKAVVATSNRLESIDSALKDAAVRPIPVQTFPITDDTRFEKEKQEVAVNAGKRIGTEGKKFITRLNEAHLPVERRMEKFFSLIDKHNEDGSNGEAMDAALKEFLDCSPKHVVAAFQKHALEIGVMFVRDFNELIDLMAREFPRCRGGIYTFRLNYADAIQISDEIIATLRATSTMLEDVQRRHDLLEALQGELLNDFGTTEIETIWAAVKGSFKDSVKGMADEDDSWLKKMLGGGVGALSWAMAVLAVPQTQFQGQLARARRIKVFLATSILMRHGWDQWSKANEDIVRPNLNVMFALKCDYVANRFISLCDLVTANGYSLANLPGKIKELEQKRITN